MTAHRIVKVSYGLLLIAGLALGPAAQAKPIQKSDKAGAPDPAASRLAIAFQTMLISQNQCINYAYDKNGNRTNQANSAFTTTHPVWGTSPYLCFTWSAN